MARHVHVYSGSCVRGDGNWDISQRLVQSSPAAGSNGRFRPFSVILAWLGLGGVLLQPFTASHAENWSDLKSDLGVLISPIKTHRVEAGLSMAASAPVMHSTDSYVRHRLKVEAFYSRMLQERTVVVESATPKADAVTVSSVMRAAWLW